jgi:glutamate 5-kinase
LVTQPFNLRRDILVSQAFAFKRVNLYRYVEVVENINDLNVDVGGAGSSVGTGGMVTKLTAARIACAAGCKTIVCLSANLERDVEAAVVEGKSVGTCFLPAKKAAKVGL